MTYSAVVDAIGVQGDFIDMRVSVHMLDSLSSFNVRIPLLKATDTEAIRQAVIEAFHRRNPVDWKAEKGLVKKLLGISFPIELPDVPDGKNPKGLR